jgi:hypothetical protein
MSARTRCGASVWLIGFALCTCAKAHDVDALNGAVRDGGQAAFAGASGSSAGDGGAGGSGTSGSGAGAGGGAGSGQPIFNDVSSCAPCLDSMGTGGTLRACCTAEGRCGLDVGPLSGRAPTCVQQNAPGGNAPNCPAFTFSGIFPLTSCCDQDGLCGVQVMQTAPLGCVDPMLLGDLVAPASSGGFPGGGFPGGGANRGGERQRCNVPVL